MKYVLTILLPVDFGLGGYWYGYRIGFEEGSILKVADIAMNSINAIDELKHNPEADPQDLYELQINKALINYGEYIEKASPRIPGFFSVEPALKHQFFNVISYRNDSPRVRDGIEYSPSNKNLKETEEYKQLQPELRMRFEREDHYYQKAMESK